jgi:hypothetical protein
VESLRAGDLTIEAICPPPPAPLRLVWRGKSDDRNPQNALAPYFAQVLERAAERGTAVEMRFDELDHFNSSTIGAVIKLIQDARARGVRLVLLYDARVKWQKLSFDALRVFKVDELLELAVVPA